MRLGVAAAVEVFSGLHQKERRPRKIFDVTVARQSGAVEGVDRVQY